jgi:hypothetical protein
MKISEIITLLTGCGVGMFLIANLPGLRKLPSYRIILASCTVFLLSWVVTNLEEIFYREFFNNIEHFLYSAGSVLLALWCWSVIFGHRGEGL